MVADACAGGVQRVVENILAQVLCEDIEEGLLASWKEVLAYATACIVVFVVGNILLIFLPRCSSCHCSLIVVFGICGVYIHQILLVCAIVAHLACLALGVVLDVVVKGLAARNLEDAVYLRHRGIIHAA